MNGIERLRANARKVQHGRDAAYVYAAVSFLESVDACEEFTHAPVGAAGDGSRKTAVAVRGRATAGDDWSFGDYHTLAQWRAAMLAGDKAGAERVARFQTAISADLSAPVGVRRKVRKGPQGDEVCPHAILRGDLPRAWTSRRRETGRAPAPVVILVPMTSNAGADAESFNYRAAAALALAGPLQRAGYKVSVLAADCVRGSYTASGAPRLTAVFHRVASGANLDIPRVTAALSAAHLRFVTFCVIASAPWNCHSNLGHANDEVGDYVALALASGMVRAGEEVLTIPAQLRDEGSARRWLGEVSARYGKQA